MAPPIVVRCSRLAAPPSRLGLLIVALCWSLSPALGWAAAPTLWGTVTDVVSATRLEVESPDSGLLKVRLLGVQTPEPANPHGRGAVRDGQPFGDQALIYMRDLLVGKQVQVDTYGRDQRGRLLAVLWLGDINVNLELIKQGLAWMEPSVPVRAVRAQLEVAERQARVGRYGLWGLPHPEPPWDFRRRHHLPAE